MSKNILVLLLLVTCLPVYGREGGQAPDVKAIKKTVSDKTSGLYYPLLMQRFMTGDTTMNLSEKRHLYYGYSASEKYSPYGGSHFQDSIRTILTLIESDYVKLLVFTDSVLKESPFNLRALNYRLHAARKMGNTEIATLTHAKIELLLDAILSSGDGRSVPGAFWVIEVSHEYFLLGVLGLEYGGAQSLVDGPCDFLTVKENKAGLKGVYFNVSIGFGTLSDMFNSADKGKKKKH